MKKNSIYVIRDDHIEEFWIYVDGIYIPQGKTYIIEFCRNILKAAYSTQLLNDVCQKIAADNYINPNKFFDVHNLDEVCTLNGILNVKTRELRPFDRETVFFCKMPVKYDPEAECPAIVRFFSQVLKNETDILRMQEVFGYCLYKDSFTEKAVMLTGPTRNGKSKTQSLLTNFLGIQNCSALSLHQLTKERYMLADLQGKLANIAGDVASTQIENIDRFKKLTGRDTIKSDRKYMTSVEFVPYAKHIFSCNQLPEPSEDQDAFFNRWELFEFPYCFLPQKELDVLPEKEKPFTKLQDPDVLDKISTQEELNGLLNWALDGLDRVLKNKDFTESKCVSDIKRLWKRKSNSLLAFMEDFLEDDYDCCISSLEVSHLYSRYCKKHKIPLIHSKMVADVFMKQFGSHTTRKFISTEDGKVTVWVGVKFKAGKLYGGFSTMKDYMAKEERV